jgi:DNA-binding phage protein
VIETRVDVGSGYRIYYGRDGSTLIILLGGGTKRRQDKDIASAKERWKDYEDSKEARRVIMPLTRQFKETIMADLNSDRAYRAAYLAEAIESMHSGEFEVGKRMLRVYINATIGFNRLSQKVGSPAKSLMRMLSPNGNPHADKLFGMIGHLRGRDRFRVRVEAARASNRRTRHTAGGSSRKTGRPAYADLQSRIAARKP